MKIIETNISYDLSGQISDHQSCIITNCQSWEDYISIFENYDGNASGFYNGSLNGRTLPNEVKIEFLEYDEYHLRCNMSRKQWSETKLAYRVEEPDVLGIPVMCGLQANQDRRSPCFGIINDGVPIGVVRYITGNVVNCDLWISNNTRWVHKEKRQENGKSEVAAIWIEDT